LIFYLNTLDKYNIANIFRLIMYLIL
jgi:hypothetical protein